MENQEYKTLAGLILAQAKIARTKNADKFVKKVIEFAPKAATFGMYKMSCYPDTREYPYCGDGFSEISNEYEIEYPKRMNHEHAIDALEKLGFRVYTDGYKLDVIEWSDAE